MKIISTDLAEVLLLEPPCFEDDRGFFLVSYNEQIFREKLGLDYTFVQDNHSRSQRNVLRGLHFQTNHPQGKLVRVVNGSIFDVVVDIRPNSPDFGRWVSNYLSAENKKMLWVPPGFAHGFLTLSGYADVLYKVTDIYSPEHEKTLAWNDPEVAINWPLDQQPILSIKDKEGLNLQNIYHQAK
ncbi:MAG: dTDP-4-dehydrorhamnose 3,5-epimerase [Synechococcaceae cyanobacterium RL_1_2]|nr:dTDP-4-dehydrorhamnose 3,5-epimerase [Synechococcaceae cyanobacterium RL_1_2]